MATKVLIVQHGEKQRQPGDPGLSDVGKAQARQVAAHLRGRQALRDIYSSPLRRAEETAAPLAGALAISVRVDPRLRERMNWEGDRVESIESFLADWSRASSDRSFRPRSGDSSFAAAARLREFLDELPEEGTFVVVTHGGVTTDLLRDLLGDDGLEAARPGLVAQGVPCGAITTLEGTAEAWLVTEIAAISHLGALMPHHPV